MFRLFQNKHEKLIEVIKAGNEAEAQQLIAQMNITELSKVDDYGKTALLWAAYKGLEKVCEALIPKMSQQAIDNVVKDGCFKGHTALSIAKEKDFKNIYDLLETHQKQILSENNELAETVNKFFHDPTSVSLCYQIITDDFAKLVADKLKTNKTITTIDFMSSTISDQGIKIITEALKASTQLKKLDFSGCDLGNQKISILAEVLQLKTLTHFCLSANYIGTVGINAIIKALKENTTITYIDLEQNNIDQQNKAIIEKYLQRNKNIEEVNKAAKKINAKVFSETVINAKDKAIIKDALEDIANSTKALNNATDMEKIIASMQELIIDKTTKLQLMTIENQLNDIIDSQVDDISILSGDSTFG